MINGTWEWEFISHHYDLYYRDNGACKHYKFFTVSVKDIKTEVQKYVLMCRALGPIPEG